MTPADELRLAASTLRHPSSARLVLPRPVRLAIAAWLDAAAGERVRELRIDPEALTVARTINGDRT